MKKALILLEFGLSVLILIRAVYNLFESSLTARQPAVFTESSGVHLLRGVAQGSAEQCNACTSVQLSTIQSSVVYYTE